MSIIDDRGHSAILKHYPAEYKYWSDVDSHLSAHKNKWGLFEAFDKLNLLNYIGDLNNLVVLDLGCGTGWLSAKLSTFQQIKIIHAIDSDENMLQTMLPAVVEKMNGDLSKIITYHGLFSPILTAPKEGYDCIFMSSAAHHHPDIFSLISDLENNVKRGGWIFILNEIPVNNWIYRWTLVKKCLIAVLNTFTKKTKLKGQAIYMNGILYDPFLGDIMYSKKLWVKILSSAKHVKFKWIDTKISLYIGSKKSNLVCFVGKKE